MRIFLIISVFFFSLSSYKVYSQNLLDTTLYYSRLDSSKFKKISKFRNLSKPIKNIFNAYNGKRSFFYCKHEFDKPEYIFNFAVKSGKVTIVYCKHKGRGDHNEIIVFYDELKIKYLIFHAPHRVETISGLIKMLGMLGSKKLFDCKLD